MAASIEQVGASAENMSGLVEQVATSVEETSRSVEGVARNAEAITRAVESAAASATELDRSLRGVASLVSEASEISRRAGREGEEGGAAIQKSIDGLARVRTSMGQSATIVREVGKRAGDAHEISTDQDVLIDRGEAGGHEAPHRVHGNILPQMQLLQRFGIEHRPHDRAATHDHAQKRVAAHMRGLFEALHQRLG